MQGAGGNRRLLRPGVIREGFLEEAGLALGLSVSCFSCLRCCQENAGLLERKQWGEK